MSDAVKMSRAFAAIESAVAHAEAKHPIWPDGIFPPLSLLGEECGEVCKAANDHEFFNGPVSDIRKELLHAAAVIVRMIKSLEDDHAE